MLVRARSPAGIFNGHQTFIEKTGRKSANLGPKHLAETQYITQQCTVTNVGSNVHHSAQSEP